MKRIIPEAEYTENNRLFVGVYMYLASAECHPRTTLPLLFTSSSCQVNALGLGMFEVFSYHQ